VTAAAGLVGYGVSRADGHGWTSVGVLGTLLAAALCAGVFVLVERAAAHPLVPRSLWRLPALRVGNLVMVLMGATMTAALFFVSLYLQQILGYSALRAGTAMLPMTVALIAGGLAARKLISTFGPRPLLVSGSLTTTVGLLVLAWLPADGGFPWRFVLASVIAGAGISLMLLPVTVSATAGVAAPDAGAASGLLNTSRQLGGAVGLAVLVTVAAAGSPNTPADVLHGYHAAFAVDAALVLLVVPLAFLLPRRI
ncbi:MFS transporter, partial [Streptomyces sp. SID3343]|uniref:MFS transporter n=1 Tax=Streptomyces sp. SID3343 TaxID=2690260 RepID=UPI001369A1FE